jgi:hypothetical protein
MWSQSLLAAVRCASAAVAAAQLAVSPMLGWAGPPPRSATEDMREGLRRALGVLAAAGARRSVLHGAGPLHRIRGHRHRLHPACQGLGRRLLRARRAHGHRAHAVPPRLALLPQGGGRQERHRRPRAGARRQLQEPPRAHAAGDGRRLELLQQGRLQAQDSH